MSSNFVKLFEFMKIVGQLKAVKRTGWVLRGVADAESVSDHMYRMAVLSFLVDDAAGKVNKEKCIKISLVHDLAESIVGDIAPADGIAKEEKSQMEEKAMQHIKGLLSDDVGSEIFSLWKEYEDQSSQEAKFVKDLDKFEMILQAHEYEQRDGCPGKLTEFFQSTEGKFKTEQVQEWAAELCKIRAKNVTKEGSG